MGAQAPLSGRLADLERLRVTLLAAISGAESTRDLAGLSREVRLVAKEIDEVRRSVPLEGSLNDELTKRRAARVGASGRSQTGSG